jgi:uncharacterized protein
MRALRGMLNYKNTTDLFIFMMKPLIINNLEFAQKQQTLADSFAVSSLKRLAETLALHDKNTKPPTINFELTGISRRFSHPSLRLHIKTKLPVICQRCLDEMLVSLDLNFDYLISDVAVNEFDENDEIDWLEVDNEMNLLELIEDELLLAMPIAPVHEKNCSKLSMQSGEKPNPFAVLKGIIK